MQLVSSGSIVYTLEPGKPIQRHDIVQPRQSNAAPLTQVVLQQDPPAGTSASPGTQITVLLGEVYAIPHYFK